jgi:dihydrofolate reductase
VAEPLLRLLDTVHSLCAASSAARVTSSRPATAFALAAVSLYASRPDPFDPEALRSLPLGEVSEALRASGVSQRHGPHVQVRKVTEYLGLTATHGWPLEEARPVIQAAWRQQVDEFGADAAGPPKDTCAALDPALWFFGKWGCTFRERSGRQLPIHSACARNGYSHVMRPLRYSINVTLDGCCDHREAFADEDLHRHAVENLEQADALLFGRVTYEMMEAAWRPPARTGARPDWMEPFARTIDAAKKYVVSSTLERVDWNAELVRGDLGKAVEQLKREPGKGLLVGGVKLPLALAELGSIDEYEFVVQPRLVGHGPTLFAGLSKRVDLKLVSRLEFGSGAVAMRYEPRR